MSNQTLFPFHPVTGRRLSATIDFVPGAVHRDISKTNGELVLEDASETTMCWNATEQQMQHGISFLTNENADECLEHEALWRAEDVDSISIIKVGSATPALTPNQLREKLAELGSAAREVILQSNEGQNIGASLASLKDLLEAMDLMEPVEEND